MQPLVDAFRDYKTVVADLAAAAAPKGYLHAGLTVATAGARGYGMTL